MGPRDTDNAFLHWIFDRLVHVYGENPSVDYMERMKSVVENQGRAVAAFKEVYDLLKDHPTNVDKLTSGQPGYDHRARYAYLVAKDALTEMGEL